MDASDVLTRSIRHTYDGLVARLEVARTMEAPPGEPRRGQQRIDTLLAATSKHLHAVDAALLRTARRRLPDGPRAVRDYLHSARTLEVALAHVKAHEYGSVYESGFAWPAVWDDLAAALGDHRRQEEALVERLAAVLAAPALERLAQRLRDAELAAPSRPHPYTPHTGLLGLMSRRVMHTVDRFWDTVEGRMVPEPSPAPRKPPGLVAQYFLADPRFEEEAGPRR